MRATTSSPRTRTTIRTSADPFTDRAFNIFDLDKDFALSDRDIRHKLNVFGYTELGPIQLNVRI